MNPISIDVQYELYKETLSKCGLFLLKGSDEDIEYNIFEEFDTDSISFLHINILNSLLAAKLIDKEIYDLSLKLALNFRALEKTDLWNIESVKTNEQWYEILKLSDNIKQLIAEKFKE